MIPVVWKGRLFLFWLRILKQARETAQKPGTGDVDLTSLKTSDIKTDAIKFTVQAVLCWSEYYNGKWQPTKTSDLNRPAHVDYCNPAGEGAFDRSQYVLSRIDGNEQTHLGPSLVVRHSFPHRFDDEPLRDEGGRSAIKVPENRRPDPSRRGSGRAQLFGRRGGG